MIAVFLISASLFLPILLAEIFLQSQGLRKDFLFEYISFESYFSYFEAFFNLVIIGCFAFICFGLGRFITKLFNIKLPESFNFGVGLIFVNIIFLPFFFLNLLYTPVVLFFFLILSFPGGAGLKDLTDSEINLNELKKYSWKILLLLIPLGVHLIDSFMPANYTESGGDIAMNYLKLPMHFSQAHGALQNVFLGTKVAALANFEALTSLLVVISNPGIVKLFGFLLFFMTFLMLWDFCFSVLKSPWHFWISFLFLISPYFMDKHLISVAHPRICVVFLSAFSFFLIYLGRFQKDYRYYLLSLLATGLLAGTNYQGMIIAFLNGIFILSDFKAFKKNYIQFGLGFIIFLLLGSVFSIWVWKYHGSPVPHVPAINKIFNFQLNPAMSNAWVFERAISLYKTQAGLSAAQYFLVISRFILDHTGLLFIFIVLGLLFNKNKKFTFVLVYYVTYVAIFLFIFPNSSDGFGNSRHQRSALPILLAGLCLSIALSEKNFKKINREKILTSFLLILTVLYQLYQSFTTLSCRGHYSECVFPNQLLFAAKKINFKHYLNDRNVYISQFLNDNFSDSDKMIYFFLPRGIYAKPMLYGSTFVGVVTEMFMIDNPELILKDWEKEGLGYLILDNVSGVSAFNVNMNIVADVSMPIFEPDFFTKHFIPLRTDLPQFFLFKIDYRGLDAQEAKKNFQKISLTGFFRFMHKSLNENQKNLLVFESAGYSAKELLKKYQQVEKEIYPSQLYRCINYGDPLLNDFAFKRLFW